MDTAENIRCACLCRQVCPVFAELAMDEERLTTASKSNYLLIAKQVSSRTPLPSLPCARLLATLVPRRKSEESSCH